MAYWITYATATHVEADGPYDSEDKARKAFKARKGWYDSYGAHVREAVDRHDAIEDVKHLIRRGVDAIDDDTGFRD